MEHQSLREVVENAIDKIWIGEHDDPPNISEIANAVLTALSNTHIPHRGSDVEGFIKRHRDERIGLGMSHGSYQALDWLLDDYRLHADTGVPLSEPTPSDGGYE